jgi:hypothetical protein
MEFALILRELAKHRVALAIGVVIAVIAATLSVYHLDGLKLKPRSLQYSSATTQALVDSESSLIGSLSAQFEPLQVRAGVYANLMASPSFLNRIGKHAGIPGDQIYAAGPVDPTVQRVVQEPTAVQRNIEISGETAPYRLNFNHDPNLPTIGIYAQAPTTKQAVQLANAAAVGLEEYVAGLGAHTSPAERVVVRQLGQANGSVVDGGISKSLAGLAFIATFVLWCALVLFWSRFRATWRASAKGADSPGHASNGDAGIGRMGTNGTAPSEQGAPDTADIVTIHPPVSSGRL